MHPGATISESEMEQQEFWRSVVPLLEPILFFLHVDIAVGRLQNGDRREVDRFFRRHLGRNATPHELAALFKIITRSQTWRKVKWPATPKYLGRAVWQEGRRLRDVWNGIPTSAERARAALVARAAWEFERSRARVLRPDRRMERKEASEFRAVLLKRLNARIRQTGSDRDRAILELREAGLSPAEVVRELGVKWSAWQGYMRKIERWMKEEVEILRSETSSRRTSAA